MLGRIFLMGLMLVLLSAVGCTDSRTVPAKNLASQALEINEAFSAARDGLLELGKAATSLYAQQKSFVPKGLAGEYKYYEGSVFYKSKDDGLCGLWASGLKPIGQTEKDEIELLEQLQGKIKAFNLSQKIVEFAYILTTDHVGMFYPYIEGISFFEPGIDFYEAYIPFYNVSPKNNPERQARWVEPYIDAAGNGYVCSVSSPVYQGATFKAAVGADIPLLQVGDLYLDQARMQMLITKDTTLVYGTKPLLKAIPVKSLDEYWYTKNVILDEFASDEFQLRKNESSEIKKLAELALTEKDFSITVGGTKYKCESALIPITGWRLIELIRE